MTDKEKAIVMAYTGVCMLSGDKFKIFHEYVENIMGRPVYTHEMAIKAVDDEIKEKAKADFIALCAEQEPKMEQFAKWVASEIFDENWEYNQDAFAEIACRKLEKLGIVRAKGDEWELVESKESDE